jgi:hypothetical protein
MNGNRRRNKQLCLDRVPPKPDGPALHLVRDTTATSAEDDFKCSTPAPPPVKRRVPLLFHL